MNPPSARQRFALRGKVAAVIGGGGHLCSAMGRGLAEAGSAVALLDLRPEKAQRAARAIGEAADVETLGLGLDATRKGQLSEALAQIEDALGPPDILINGAGINDPTPFFDIDVDDWRKVISSHLDATFLGCQVFGAHMVRRGAGSIINISSAAAGPPLSKAFAYSVAKAGVRNLTQNLGREWASCGVRVNAIRPGFFPTEWNRRNFIDEERETAILGHTPMGRYGEPEELVGAAVWLASEASSFVTGAEIAVDGGFSCMTL